MPPLAVVLVVGAAACHCAWNLALKSAAHRTEVSLGALVVGVLIASPALLVHSVREVTAEGWLLVLLSAAFETAYFVALTAAYAAGDLSLVYPIARGTPALVIAPLSVALLGDRLSPEGVVGIALVVVGLFATHRSEGGARTGPPQGRAVVLAILTGLAIAGYSFVNKLGVARMPVPLYAALVFTLVAVLLTAVLGFRGQLRWPLLPPGAWKPAVAVGLLMMAAYLGVLAAMARAPLAYVVASREVSIVFTTLAGIVILGEPASARRLGAATLIFAGLVTIALSR